MEAMELGWHCCFYCRHQHNIGLKWKCVTFMGQCSEFYNGWWQRLSSKKSISDWQFYCIVWGSAKQSKREGLIDVVTAPLPLFFICSNMYLASYLWPKNKECDNEANKSTSARPIAFGTLFFCFSVSRYLLEYTFPCSFLDDCLSTK